MAFLARRLNPSRCHQGGNCPKSRAENLIWTSLGFVVPLHWVESVCVMRRNGRAVAGPFGQSEGKPFDQSQASPSDEPRASRTAIIARNRWVADEAR